MSRVWKGGLLLAFLLMLPTTVLSQEVCFSGYSRGFFFEVPYSPSYLFKSDCSTKAKNDINKLIRDLQSELSRCTSATPPTPVPPPAPPPPDPVPEPPPPPMLPGLQAWEASMLTEGKKQALESRIVSDQLWEGGVWYYDGAWVFFQIADYLGASHPDHAQFVEAAGWVLDRTYRAYALGGATGWRNFSHGLEQDYVRNGRDSSKQAVYALADQSPYCCQTASSSFHADWDLTPKFSREVAFAIQSFLTSERLGHTPKSNLPFYIDVALGHFTQWMQNRPPYTKPFMLALTAHALIEFDTQKGDPRIRPAIEQAFNWLWETSDLLDAPNNRFWYSYEDPTGGANPVDLNLLIAPVYAWLYRQTNDPKHLTRADTLFEAGAQNAWLGNGKQFSQNYRHGFQFLRWRNGQ